jgi:hypothetical protein
MECQFRSNDVDGPNYNFTTRMETVVPRDGSMNDLDYSNDGFDKWDASSGSNDVDGPNLLSRTTRMETVVLGEGSVNDLDYYNDGSG